MLAACSLLFGVSIIAIFILLALLLICTVRKKPTKKIGIAILVFFGVMIVSIAMVPVEKEDPDDALTKAEFIALCDRCDYDSVTRYPEDYKGARVVFRGKVTQAIDTEDQVVLLLQVNGEFWDDMYVTYEKKSDNEMRILEDDLVVIYGKMDGLKTFQTGGRGTRTLPKMIAKYIDLL